jgi:predicted esterase YcpF (UPF0227 family)
MSAGILYLHGFCSSPESWKAKVLGEAMRARGLADRFFCPALSPVPNEAIAQAEAIIESRERELTLVGSSLGGYYATYLAEKHDLRAALVNPAVVAPLSLNAYIGTQKNLHTGETFEFTAGHIDQLRALECAVDHAGALPAARRNRRRGARLPRCRPTLRRMPAGSLRRRRSQLHALSRFVAATL